MITEKEQGHHSQFHTMPAHFFRPHITLQGGVQWSLSKHPAYWHCLQLHKCFKNRPSKSEFWRQLPRPDPADYTEQRMILQQQLSDAYVKNDKHGPMAPGPHYSS
jgi:hypothetical protein